MNQIVTVSNNIGVFYGQCSELCGVSHGFMPIKVNIISLSEYYNWIDTVDSINFEEYYNLLESKQI